MAARAQWTPDDFQSRGVSMCAKLGVSDQEGGGGRPSTVTMDAPHGVSRAKTAKKRAIKSKKRSVFWTKSVNLIIMRLVFC